MPTPTKYRCIRCDTGFMLDLFSPEERREEERRRPDMRFGGPMCPNCQSTDVLKEDELKRSR